MLLLFFLSLSCNALAAQLLSLAHFKWVRDKVRLSSPSIHPFIPLYRYTLKNMKICPTAAALCHRTEQTSRPRTTTSIINFTLHSTLANKHAEIYSTYVPDNMCMSTYRAGLKNRLFFPISLPFSVLNRPFSTKIASLHMSNWQI